MTEYKLLEFFGYDVLLRNPDAQGTVLLSKGYPDVTNGSRAPVRVNVLTLTYQLTGKAIHSLTQQHIMKQADRKYRRIFSIALIFIALVASFFVSERLIAQSQEKETIRLIVRGDDMGVSHSVNTAIIDGYKKGIQKSTEVIVPGPWFPEVVKLLNENPGLDVGVHLALTSEWDNIKWRPLTNSPSLTDSLGYFYPFIWPHELYGDANALISQDWSIEEIEQELRRQIEEAKATLPNVTHVSSHMGFSGMNPKVADLVNRLAVEYRLDMDLTALGVEPMRIERDTDDGEELIQAFIETLKELPPGDYIYVTHPDLDTPESSAMVHKGYTIDRQVDYRLITSRRVQKVIEELNIQIISYSDLKR